MMRSHVYFPSLRVGLYTYVHLIFFLSFPRIPPPPHATHILILRKAFAGLKTIRICSCLRILLCRVSFPQGETKPNKALFNDCLAQAYNPPEMHGSSSKPAPCSKSSPFSHLIGQEMAQTTSLVDKFPNVLLLVHLAKDL
jgi:hypothetical protein